MRKYKAWHKAEKVMCEVSVINFDKGAFLIGVKPGKDEIYDKEIVIAPTDGRFCNWDEIEMLESTGLKDKHGVEVFEGDIITFRDGGVESTESGYQVNEQQSTGIVEWCQYELRWDVTNRLSIEMDEFDENEVEVIGNIHSNPDLV